VNRTVKLGRCLPLPQQTFALDSSIVRANLGPVIKMPERESYQVNQLTKNAPKMGALKKIFRQVQLSALTRDDSRDILRAAVFLW